MPTWTDRRDPVPTAADGDMRDTAQVMSFQGDDRADFRVSLHHLAYPAQIAQSLFAHVAGDEHVHRWLQAGALKQLWQ
mgnify:CR=1 FL=1